MVWGSNPGGGEVFHAFQTYPDPRTAPCTVFPRPFVRLKRQESDADDLSSFSVEVMNELEIYFRLPSVPA
jgi:hypothetical protein